MFLKEINGEIQRAFPFFLLKSDYLRCLLSDDQRRRPAVNGKILGRKMLEHLAGIVTPDTILRWHRELVARHWDYSGRRKNVGRPPLSKEIVELVLRIARESPTWGYDRIQGALANPGHRISDPTVANILGAHGIEPAPDRRRQSTWKTFLQSHWDVLASVDFTTLEVWTKSGLVTCSLSWNWPRGECTSPGALRIPTKAGCSRLLGTSPMPKRDSCAGRSTC
jgi:hypothetical protein